MSENTLANTRRDPRFVAERQVQVSLPGREALGELWTKDISKGGLFVKTDTPIAPQTRIAVTLATPDGMLVLEAEVVHFLDPVIAAQIGHPPGVGLQFMNLSGTRQEALESYLTGMAATLGEVRENRTGLSADQVLADMKRVLSKSDAGDLYGALGADPNTITDAIVARIDALKASFAQPPAEFPPPQVARLEVATRALDRMRHLLANGQRRFDYDQQLKVPFNEERFFDAYSQGVSSTVLRKLWQDRFPSKLTKAASHATQALELEKVSKLKEAADAGELALALDPFNVELQAAILAWRQAVDAPS